MAWTCGDELKYIRAKLDELALERDRLRDQAKQLRSEYSEVARRLEVLQEGLMREGVIRVDSN